MNIITIKERKISKETFEVRDLRHRYYVINDAYLDEWARKCGIYATGVYNSLCRHADRRGSCFPSVPLIADELAVSVSQVKRAIKVLEAHNIIKVERSSGGNNKYWLVDRSDWKDSKIVWHGYGGSRPATKEEIAGMKRRTVGK